MIMPDGAESQWDSKAEGMLACLILYTVRLESGQRTLSQIRNFSTLPPESFKQLLLTISTDGPMTAAELAASFLAMESSEEFKSVLSNVEKATRVWSAGGPAAHVTSESTLQPCGASRPNHYALPRGGRGEALRLRGIPARHGRLRHQCAHPCQEPQAAEAQSVAPSG
ncbi:MULTISPECIES: hypothetical protein [unclassified Bradyrhizobium]|uniref:hypothetical protein n=1 Tax=Bradyrhizobium sp. IC4060 TaxID=2793807 RepID=UPI00201C8B99|nr:MULTISPECIES: hypothetical protein [unclassified Bradyrhizobium]